jgi:uncharacterized protein DUF4386
MTDETCGRGVAHPTIIAALDLGVWLAIDGFAYVTLSLTSVLLPQHSDKVSTYSQPAFFGEVAFMLWLVIKGAKPPALSAAASLSAAG